MDGHVSAEADTSVEFQATPISSFLGNRQTGSHGPFTWGPPSVSKTVSAITQCLAGRTQFPILFWSSQKAYISQESPPGQGSWAERLHNKAIFVRWQSHVWTMLPANFELNATKFQWTGELKSFQPPVPLENQAKNDSIHRCLQGGSSLYLWDRAALWCSVTLRCSWRHGSEEQALNVKGPQTSQKED